jgi:hypothetical protein
MAARGSMTLRDEDISFPTQINKLYTLSLKEILSGLSETAEKFL